ncbi:glutamine cyclotransferase [Capnocytophaga canimorsus]|uniref:glutaminyl-peptide cyclotransferase n=1 Tax=Capnocytophaga canimorsus TaxID=28188 RepID=UPI001AD1EF18|nr:glutaminyl-peptide cyclotransferase [Capnocytophaga canimorsus]GIM56480.1 glutamine cyclotransferase [Capnocytophaga canimorsus]
MKLVVYFIFAMLLCTSCNGVKPSKNFDIQIIANNKNLKLNDSIQLSVKHNHFTSPIKSVAYYINQKELPKTENGVILSEVKLGKQILQAIVTLEDETTQTLEKEVTIFSKNPPKILKYKIIKEYPHDITAYTQGLEFKGDTLIESTGQYGKSVLRKWNVFNGKIYNEIRLDEKYFSEGITSLNNKIFLLTWLSKTGFIYDSNLNLIKSFNYGKSQEGWGLCNDGNKLYKSDGSEKIWTLNADSLKEESFIQLTSNQSIYQNANELEWVSGKIYANTYQKDGIMVINPNNGAIEAIVDVRGLKEKVKQIPSLDVLNGIAYHPTRKTFFITGKNWSSVFEVIFEE